MHVKMAKDGSSDGILRPCACWLDCTAQLLLVQQKAHLRPAAPAGSAAPPPAPHHPLHSRHSTAGTAGGCEGTPGDLPSKHPCACSAVSRPCGSAGSQRRRGGIKGTALHCGGACHVPAARMPSAAQTCCVIQDCTDTAGLHLHQCWLDSHRILACSPPGRAAQGRAGRGAQQRSAGVAALDRPTHSQRSTLPRQCRAGAARAAQHSRLPTTRLPQTAGGWGEGRAGGRCYTLQRSKYCLHRTAKPGRHRRLTAALLLSSTAWQAFCPSRRGAQGGRHPTRCASMCALHLGAAQKPNQNPANQIHRNPPACRRCAG